MSNEYEFALLKEYSPAAVAQIEAIYDKSFPREERKPFFYIENALQRDHYHVFVMRRTSEQKEIIAFSLMPSLRTSNAMYIEYYAVASELRGQGIGSVLFRELVAYLKEKGSTAIVWEVDPPKQVGDDNTRRIVFYERLGAHVIEGVPHYGMPNYFKGHDIIPFKLMWISLRDERSQPTKAELITFIRDIYETEYPGHDAQRDEIIASLE